MRPLNGRASFFGFKVVTDAEAVYQEPKDLYGNFIEVWSLPKGKN
jgi:hypothetical protein